MKKQILSYRRRTDALIEKKPVGTDWNKAIEEHLVKIDFYSHERLVHLIVTALFAVIEMIEILIICVCEPNVTLLALAVLTAALLIPYIFHYYTLENEVQKMYEQYDKLLEYSREDKTDGEI